MNISRSGVIQILELTLLTCVLHFACAAQSPVPTHLKANRDDFVKERLIEAPAIGDAGISIVVQGTNHDVFLETSHALDERDANSFLSDTALGRILANKGFKQVILTNGKQYWGANPCEDGFCQPYGPVDEPNSTSELEGSHSGLSLLPKGDATTSRALSDEAILRLTSVQGRLSDMPTDDLDGALKRLTMAVKIKAESGPKDPARDYIASQITDSAHKVHELLADFPSYFFDTRKYAIPPGTMSSRKVSEDSRQQKFTIAIHQLSGDLEALQPVKKLVLDDSELKWIKPYLSPKDFDRMQNTIREMGKAQRQLVSLQKASDKKRAADVAAETRRLVVAKAEADYPVAITVLRSSFVSITKRDRNGYTASESRPLQRLIVEVGGQKQGDGIMIGGGMSGVRPRIFWGHGATGDLLCLQNCPILEVGKTYHLQLGRYVTHESAHSASRGYSYDNVPYLKTDGKRGISAWQILELCNRSGDGCLAMSTVGMRE